MVEHIGSHGKLSLGHGQRGGYAEKTLGPPCSSRLMHILDTICSSAPMPMATGRRVGYDLFRRRASIFMGQANWRPGFLSETSGQTRGSRVWLLAPSPGAGARCHCHCGPDWTRAKQLKTGTATAPNDCSRVEPVLSAAATASSDRRRVSSNQQPALYPRNHASPDPLSHAGHTYERRQTCSTPQCFPPGLGLLLRDTTQALRYPDCYTALLPGSSARARKKLRVGSGFMYVERHLCTCAADKRPCPPMTPE